VSSTQCHVLVILGPTASGKTNLSIQLASACSGEIVSADSRQLYRFLDIGTAKPTSKERKSIPHHCIDIKNPDEPFNAGMFSQLAREIIDDILRCEKTPIVVGGSGLYIKALIDGVIQGDYRDEGIREKLKERESEEGLDSLFHYLKKVDPEAAGKIHSNDSKRINRALEVYEITGSPISQLQKFKTIPANFPSFQCGLQWPRERLYQRIEQRVDKMMESGLVDEVEKLREMGYNSNLNSLNTLGYKEIFLYLDGQLSKEEAVELIKRNTRRFAKRQMTWFRRDSRIQWIPVNEPVDWEVIVQQILERGK